MTAIKIYPNHDSLARAAADHFSELAIKSIARQGRFSVALAGGSTPRAIYALLASGEFAHVDWSHVHVFWGDERCVPPDHPDSNYRMARETLLDHIPIPRDNVHPIHGEMPADQATADYERELRAFLASVSHAARGKISPISKSQSSINYKKSFDLVLLGMGGDGHTASLFPGTPALGVRDRWVTAVKHDRPPPPLVDRVSLTLPAINAADQATFIVSGANKAKRLRQVLSHTSSPPVLPAQLVQPARGRLLWLVDEAAATIN